MKKLSVLLLLLTLTVTGVYGESMRLPNILSDHMVLQQQAFVKIWGLAEPEKEVKVKARIRPKTLN